MLSVILLCMLMILLSTQVWSGIWSVATTRIGFTMWIWSERHCRLGQEVTCWFHCINLTGFILQSVLENLLECWGVPSFLNWIGALTLSLMLKLSPRKLIYFMKFLSPKVTLYLYKSTIWPCLEYCYHVLVCAPSCYLELFNKLQQQRCWPVGFLFATSLESLAHLQNVVSLSLFYRYYLCRCYYELAQLVPLPDSWGRSTCYSDKLHDFSVIIPRCHKDVYVNSFFPCMARSWNSLPIEYFH